MKIKNKLHLAMGLIALGISAHCIAMVQPPKPPVNNNKLPSFWHAAIKPDPATLQELPTDLKKYLIPFIVSGNIEKGLVTIARINKTFHALINDPMVMIRIFDWLLANSRYTANAIETISNLIQKMQNKTKTLPVLQSWQVTKWLYETRGRLKNGQELFNVSVRNLKEDVERLLEDKDIDLLHDSLLRSNMYRSSSEIVQILLSTGINVNVSSRRPNMTTPLISAIFAGRLETVQMLLDAGADPEMKHNGMTPLTYALNLADAFNLGGHNDLTRRRIVEILEEASEAQKRR